MAADLLTIQSITKEAIKRFRESSPLVSQQSLAEYYLQQGILQKAIARIVGDVPDAPIWQQTATEMLEQVRAKEAQMAPGLATLNEIYGSPLQAPPKYEYVKQAPRKPRKPRVKAAPKLLAPSWPPRRELIFEEEVAPVEVSVPEIAVTVVYGHMLVRHHSPEGFVCQAR
jgi:hypothetical protein